MSALLIVILQLNVQSAKILLVPSKCEIDFGTLSKIQSFQYYNNNIGLFFVLPI